MVVRTRALFALDGRVAVVTGGMGQVGSEIVRGLREYGARVGIFDVAADDTEDSFRVDVTDRGAVERATDELTRRWDVPDVLVNAAAQASARP